MKREWIKVAVLVAVTCMAAGTAAAAEIKVGGGGASMSGVFAPVKPYFEKATGDTLIVLPSTPKDGVVDLLHGKLDLAAGAVPFESMVSGAEKDGEKVDLATLVRQEISVNRTVVLVHPSNQVARLSREELKGIFSGKIGNWKAVGGEDKDIVVVWGKGTPGQNAQFKKEILDGEEVAKDILETTNYAKIRESVAATPEAVGIDPFGMADPTVKVVEGPVLTSPIIAITVGAPSPKVQRLLDYIKGAGSVYLKK